MLLLLLSTPGAPACFFKVSVIRFFSLTSKALGWRRSHKSADAVDINFPHQNKHASAKWPLVRLPSSISLESFMGLDVALGQGTVCCRACVLGCVQSSAYIPECVLVASCQNLS